MSITLPTSANPIRIKFVKLKSHISAMNSNGAEIGQIWYKPQFNKTYPYRVFIKQGHKTIDEDVFKTIKDAKQYISEYTHLTTTTK